MSLHCGGTTEDRQYEYKNRIELEHAMAMYGWSFALNDFREQGGVLQVIAIYILSGIARIACIIFWENLFATAVALVAFSYAFVHYGQFTLTETAILFFAGVFFLSPVLCFIWINLRLEWRGMVGMTEEQYWSEFYESAKVVNDFLKPFHFFGLAILLLLPMGWFLILR